MASVKLWVKLFAIGSALSMSLAVNCNWKTQYEYQGRCCDACPSGEYPKILCNDTSPSVCEKCPAANTRETRCSCSDKTLCSDSNCSGCSSRPRCQQGEELRRKGSYKFNYICEPCPNKTYSDEEDSTCEPITQCRKLGLSELFPGNRTHNARCGCHGQCLLPDNESVCHQLSPNIKTAGLAITILICLTLLINLALFINLYLRRNTERRKAKKYHLYTRSLLLLSDECGCKLSKEEMGEKTNAHGINETSTTSFEG